MKLYLNPWTYSQIRTEGEGALPERLAVWARSELGPLPEIPVTVDYAARAGWWRLADGNDKTILEATT